MSKPPLFGRRVGLSLWVQVCFFACVVNLMVNQAWSQNKIEAQLDLESAKSSLDGKSKPPYLIMLQINMFEVILKNVDKIGFIYDILGEVGNFRGTNLAGDPTVESNLGVLGSGNRNEMLPSGLNIVANIFEGDEGEVRAVLQALSEDQLISIHSNPILLTLDQQPAYMETGEDVPYLERKNLGNVETFTTSYVQTGLNLVVKPTVGFSDSDIQHTKPFVHLDIDASLSTVSGFKEEEGFTQPILETREYKTNVWLRPGERIIIGSLYRDSQTNISRGIPILQDVPLLGRLFRGTSDESNVSQLYVMVRPVLLDIWGNLIGAEAAINPEEDSRELRKKLEDRTREIKGQMNPYEDFRELFIDRSSPQ